MNTKHKWAQAHEQAEYRLSHFQRAHYAVEFDKQSSQQCGNEKQRKRTACDRHRQAPLGVLQTILSVIECRWVSGIELTTAFRASMRRKTVKSISATQAPHSHFAFCELTLKSVPPHSV